MGRHIYQGTAQDGSGRLIQSANITVYLDDGTTLATIYDQSSGGTAVTNSLVQSDAYGWFEFWVDDSEYMPSQKFDIVLSKTGYTSQTWEDVKIIPDEPYFYYCDATATDQGAATTRADRSLKDLIDSISDASATIILPNSGTGNTTTYTLTTSETVPANIILKMEPGAILDGAGTLTINSDFDHPRIQCFGSSITISGLSKSKPEWFGPNTTPGTTVMSEEFLSAMNSLSDGGIMSLAPTTYAANLELKGRFVMEGHGRYDTIIVPASNSQHVLYDLDSDVRGVELRNFMIDADGQDSDKDGIHLETENNLNWLHDLHIVGAGRQGIYIDGQRDQTPDSIPGTTIAGGRWNTIDTVEIFNCGTGGLYVYNCTAPNVRNVRSALHGGGSYTGYGFDFVYCVEIHADYLESWYCRYGLHIKGGSLCQLDHLKIDHWGYYQVFIEANETDGQKIDEITIDGLTGGSDRVEADDTYPAIYVKSSASYSVEHLNIRAISLQTGAAQNTPSLAVYEDDTATGGIYYNQYEFNKIWWGATVVEESEISLASSTLSHATYLRRAGGVQKTDQYTPYQTLTTGAGQTLKAYGTTALDTSGGTITGTLGSADNIGEEKLIVMTVAGNNATITITNHELGDGGTYVFDAADEAVLLKWIGTEWVEVGTWGIGAYTP